MGFEYQLGACQNALNIVTKTIDSGIPCDHVNYKPLYDELSKLAGLLPDSMAMFRERLKNKLLPNLKLKDLQQMNHLGQMIALPRNGINPYVLGQVIATLHYISEMFSQKPQTEFWDSIHEVIALSSKQLFENGHYAESVEAAFLEITVRIKNIVREQAGEDVDGTAAMQKAFSVNNPLIKASDITTRTGKDIQQGLMELFTGSVRYIRNPQAHEKIVMDKTQAIHKLYLASLLMVEIDKAVIYQ